ncbi:hypothetical protein BD311DRAFT_915 [Dichomitus squalens]|uniref:Uncharacterized protein n=1 Tax=Dichomitus squalens TaxID=114155 RepID=A0A4Q9N492_9APHY|nr:hypothetical protein BD311DRAFT_915 [Dichomitus squalens]
MSLPRNHLTPVRIVSATFLDVIRTGRAMTKPKTRKRRMQGPRRDAPGWNVEAVERRRCCRVASFTNMSGRRELWRRDLSKKVPGWKGFAGRRNGATLCGSDAFYLMIVNASSETRSRLVLQITSERRRPYMVYQVSRLRTRAASSRHCDRF